MYYPKDGWTLTFDLNGVEINGKILNEVIMPKKPNNNAPKTIKGDYDLSIHGNKIVLVDNVDGTTVEAKCHPDDDFEIGVGIKEAFRKINARREEIKKQKDEEEKKIKVGDWVEVVDAGYGYRTWYEWLPSDRFDLIKNFGYGYLQKNGTKGLVMYIKDNVVGCYNDNGTLVYYQDKDGMCHTIELCGLKKVAKPNA